jgi:hypothetical protein
MNPGCPLHAEAAITVINLPSADRDPHQSRRITKLTTFSVSRFSKTENDVNILLSAST